MCVRLCVYLCTTDMQEPVEAKKGLDPLELYLQMAVSHPVGTDNQI